MHSNDNRMYFDAYLFCTFKSISYVLCYSIKVCLCMKLRVLTLTTVRVTLTLVRGLTFVTNKIFIFSMWLTVCPGSSDPPEEIFNIFASENEAYTIY